MAAEMLTGVWVLKRHVTRTNPAHRRYSDSGPAPLLPAQICSRCHGQDLPSFCALAPTRRSRVCAKRLGSHSLVGGQPLYASHPGVSLTSLVRSRAGSSLTILSMPGTMHNMEPGEDINGLAQVRKGVA